MSPPRGRLVGGLDLGGTKIQAVLLDGRRRVVAEQRRPTPQEGGPEDVVAAVAYAPREKCAKAEIEKAEAGAKDDGTADAPQDG